ncbi:MAG: phosphoribosylglycinamide formyltransferase [Vampirovibrionia bacterium]
MDTSNKVYNLAVLISGNGSNLQSIIDSTKTNTLNNAVIKIVISNKHDAYGLKRAEENNIKTLFMNPVNYDNDLKYDKEIVNTLIKEKIDLVILAGYLKIITEPLLKHYNKRILNIHPSLLPKFGGAKMYGINVHKSVIKSKEKYSGCTVHIVTKDIDCGPILAQEKVNVLDDDTPETLAKRILNYEHNLYPKTIKQYLCTLYEE